MSDTKRPKQTPMRARYLAATAPAFRWRPGIEAPPRHNLLTWKRVAWAMIIAIIAAYAAGRGLVSLRTIAR